MTFHYSNPHAIKLYNCPFPFECREKDSADLFLKVHLNTRFVANELKSVSDWYSFCRDVYFLQKGQDSSVYTQLTRLGFFGWYYISVCLVKLGLDFGFVLSFFLIIFLLLTPHFPSASVPCPLCGELPLYELMFLYVISVSLFRF